MVDYKATELEYDLSVQLSSLTTYIMNLAVAYKKDVMTAKDTVDRLQKENKQLKEKLTLQTPPQRVEGPIEMEEVTPEEEQIGTNNS